MTAHDPRVTLTEAEREAICICAEQVMDGSVATDEQIKAGCDGLAADVAAIIAARLAPIRALADEWSAPESHRAGAYVRERDAADRIRAALDAPVSASQDHDGAEGQGEGCRPCCDAHPTQGCADVGCRHDCEGWIERFEERLR